MSNFRYVLSTISIGLNEKLKYFYSPPMSINGAIKRTKLEIEEIDEIPGLKLIRPKLFPDNRGYFVESYNEQELASQGFLEKFKQVFFCSLFPVLESDEIICEWLIG